MQHSKVTICFIPLAAEATPAQARPQAAARVNRPATITPKAVRANEPQEDDHSFVMIEQFGNDTPRAEKEEARRGDDERKAASSHSVEEALSDYIVINPQDYREMKEKARKEHEQKTKKGTVDDIDRMKEEWERQYEEERIKSGITEGGALQRQYRIDAQRQELKDSGKFFMRWLKAR